MKQPNLFRHLVNVVTSILANERTSAAAKHNISIPRDELVARIARARVDPRFKQLVAVMFRNRRTDDATDEELRAFDETEALADEQH